MKFIEFVDFDKEKILNFSDKLDEFVVKHNLDIKWERDIALTLIVMNFVDGLEINERFVNYESKVDEFVAKNGWNGDHWTEDIKKLLSRITYKPIDYMIRHQDIVRMFAISKVPALLVQETSFHTLDMARSDEQNVVLLQPMHQTLYNNRESGIAIPSKKQSHGRINGNDMRLPLFQDEVWEE